MKQSNFHTAMLKIKRTALLAVGLTLFQLVGITFLKLLSENSCRYENKVLTLR